MSYQDPYYASQHQRPYTDAPVPGEYDPYNTRQRFPTYDQSGYHDDDAYRNNAGFGGAPGAGGYEDVGQTREKTRYEETFPPVFRPPKSTGAIRIWRKDNRGPLWTKGGRGKCFLRFFCCSILIFLFLVIGIILSLGIWIRPPDVTINDVSLNSTGGSAATITSTTLSLNFGVNISVDNPNYFDIDFKKVKVNLTYPLNDMDLGGGQKTGIKFKSHAETTFNFPFTLTYNLTGDSNREVLNDLLSKCGFTGTKEDITVDYKITLGIKIIAITISPSFSSSFSFECPSDEIESFLESAGIDISSITSALSSG